MLVVQSSVKEVIKSANGNTAAEVIDALNNVIDEIIRKAVERAKANGRKTVKGCDM